MMRLSSVLSSRASSSNALSRHWDSCPPFPSLKGEERRSVEDGVNEVQQVVSQKIETNHENIHGLTINGGAAKTAKTRKRKADLDWD